MKGKQLLLLLIMKVQCFTNVREFIHGAQKQTKVTKRRMLKPTTHSSEMSAKNKRGFLF